LESWKEIAAYLNREVRTAMRWEKERGLPVHRVPGKRSGVYAFAVEVDAWLRSEAAGHPNGDGLPEGFPAPQAKPRKLALWAILSATILLLGIATVVLSVSATRAATPQLRNSIAVTNDGLIKNGLFFGGQTLYFVDRDGERWTLMRTRAGRAAPSFVISYSQGSLWPMDISLDESELLVTKADFLACPCPLWVIPPSGGSWRRLADIVANVAEWSPDGTMLAYASGRDLYVARHNGTMTRRLTTLRSPAVALYWSPDGKRLRIITEELHSQESGRLWEAELDRPIARRVLPGWSRGPQDFEGRGRWTPNGEFFVFGAVHNGVPGLFAIRERWPFYDRFRPVPIRLTTNTEIVTDPAPTPDGKKIFAIVQTQLRGELNRYEEKSGQFVTWPRMPGPSAGHVAFSPDGHEAAYVSYPEMHLWKMKADGTEKRQLTFGTLRASMPQWSPHGRRIAFMGWEPDITKIRIIPAEGGPLDEPVTWPGWQGIPTWTPDGTGLVFGENGPVNPIPASCTIHLFDFKTGKTSDMPGTTGLWTARACPTGRYVAATSRDQGKLVLYDMQTARVTDLVAFPDTKVGDNPTWSKDGKFIYIDAPLSSDPAIYRIRITDRHIERVASLKGIQRANMDHWIGLTPDGSPLVTRRVQGSEIYAWDWVAP